MEPLARTLAGDPNDRHETFRDPVSAALAGSNQRLRRMLVHERMHSQRMRNQVEMYREAVLDAMDLLERLGGDAELLLWDARRDNDSDAMSDHDHHGRVAEWQETLRQYARVCYLLTRLFTDLQHRLNDMDM